MCRQKRAEDDGLLESADVVEKQEALAVSGKEALHIVVRLRIVTEPLAAHAEKRSLRFHLKGHDAGLVTCVRQLQSELPGQQALAVAIYASPNGHFAVPESEAVFERKRITLETPFKDAAHAVFEGFRLAQAGLDLKLIVSVTVVLRVVKTHDFRLKALHRNSSFFV